MQNFHDLVGGFHHFRANYFLKEKEFFEALAHSQSPKTMVIACCDSRTDPAIVLGCKPGDLFVVRSVAAIVPPPEKAGEYDAVMAAVEYGVKHLNVENIVVMGHSNCGGIAGLFNPHALKDERYINRWVSLACPAVHEIEEENPDESQSEKGSHGFVVNRKFALVSLGGGSGSGRNVNLACSILRYAQRVIKRVER